MNISIYLKNAESGQATHVETFVNNYRPNGRNNYSAQRNIDSTKNTSLHFIPSLQKIAGMLNITQLTA